MGQPLATVLRADNAPVQGTDRFVLEASNACLVDDVNIGDGVSEYVYDALGRRIEKRSGGVATRYLHDGARVAEEWDVPAAGSPALAASYVYGNYIDEVLTMRRGGTDYYYHADDQHNVVKLTDGAGAVVEAYDYADYGLPEFFDAAGNGLTGTAYANPYLFTGRQWDAELGYYYYRNRYLDPAHGRFASRDPLGIWGDPLNLGNGYTYAGSNPWSLVDPFGLAAGGNSNQEGPLGKMWRGFWKRIWDLGLFVLEADKLMKDPDHLAEQTLKATDEVKSTIGAVKEDPVGAARAVGDAAKEKLQNFGWEDAGYGAPDIAMSIKSLPNLLREAGNVVRAGAVKEAVSPPRLRDPKTGRFVSDPNNPPSPYTFTDAERRKAWRKLAEDPNSGLTPDQRDMIRERGWRGPQQRNDYGELETMELSHEPVPLRKGGKDVVPLWPEEHAARDPHRRLKKR